MSKHCSTWTRWSVGGAHALQIRGLRPYVGSNPAEVDSRIDSANDNLLIENYIIVRRPLLVITAAVRLA